jgi:hypothetical protein
MGLARIFACADSMNTNLISAVLPFVPIFILMMRRRPYTSMKLG